MLLECAYFSSNFSLDVLIKCVLIRKKGVPHFLSISPILFQSRSIIFLISPYFPRPQSFLRFSISSLPLPHSVPPSFHGRLTRASRSSVLSPPSSHLMLEPDQECDHSNVCPDPHAALRRSPCTQYKRLSLLCNYFLSLSRSTEN